MPPACVRGGRRTVEAVEQAASRLSSDTPGPSSSTSITTRSPALAAAHGSTRRRRRRVARARSPRGWRGTGRGTSGRPRPAAGPRRTSTSTVRPPRSGRSRSMTAPAASSTSSASRRAWISPAWIRLRSRSAADHPVEPHRLVLDGGGGRAHLLGRCAPCPGPRCEPAAARIPASGVRRSCDTESTSALLSAASRRATSASTACARSRVALDRERRPGRRRGRGGASRSDRAARAAAGGWPTGCPNGAAARLEADAVPAIRACPPVRRPSRRGCRPSAGSASLAHEHLDGRWRGRQRARRAVGEDPLARRRPRA